MPRAGRTLAAFWTERNLLARRLLHDGDAAGAYALAAGPWPDRAGAVLDAEFLAGFIALRRLNDPAAALRHFQALAAAVEGGDHPGSRVITGWAAPRPPRARTRKPDYAKAAAWPTTFYGQLAALALGDDAAALARRISGAARPRLDARPGAWPSPAGGGARRRLLVAWGEPQRARAFLLRMDELPPTRPTAR